ncbi:MAG: hypothetical protein JOZ33_07155 [Acidobacteriaceae bacterium]|nr:hypothetical protein [Acidobacteriaceae bacterium]
MIHFPLWAWTTLLILGARHGLNKEMGWLFAVALGLQQQDARAVWRSLLPIAAGHLVAVGLVVGVALVAGTALPLSAVKIGVAVLLIGFGVYRLSGKGHLRWGGMKVGFLGLAFWSFLMASAHGAGFMLLPVLLKVSATPTIHMEHALHEHAMPGLGAAWTAITVHTGGYLVAMGAIAWIVYEKFGLSLLRKAWLNVDLVWAVALIATGGLTLVLA